ncbi:hypothetical protein C8A05DRAFT_15626 [Staphylotrichum tortipilum]|uniref:Uncharacterized protein n=1 Tax=Staphylotrichum tortipilum TaxID=2831512 RepID=A0AAN6MKI9_9PEZI|nr:hypothetical protein C8A05DRAFT_15626 [Staphylotrichum longicolle]
MRQFGEGATATWTRELEYARGLPSWAFLLALGKESYDWLQADAHRRRWSMTGDGTCLVATLSYPLEEGYRVYQCTIPRAQWHQLMETYGQQRASCWYEASETRAPANGRRHQRAFHAEDGVYYLAETKNRDGLPSLMGETRLIIYGIKAGSSTAGQVNLCTDVMRKNPPCREVAGNLGVSFITVGAADQDRADQTAGGSDGRYAAAKPPGPGGASDPRRPGAVRPTGRAGPNSSGGSVASSSSSSSRANAAGNGSSSGRSQVTPQATASSSGMKRGSGK